jgi:hypothetical protein
MRIVLVAAFTALVSGPAFAQMPNLATSIDKPLTQDEVDRKQKRDEGYRAGLSQIPNQKNVDPWGNVRNADKPAAKQARPAPKANPK